MAVVSVAIPSGVKELRAWKVVDYLDILLRTISCGDIEELKKILHCEILLHHFKVRLLEVRVHKGTSSLIKAIQNGHLQMFTYILNNFPFNLEQSYSEEMLDVGAIVYGASPLWIASYVGHIKFVKILVARGANIEHGNDLQFSPLIGAVINGHFDVCDFLISSGANVDRPNILDMGPLAMAANMQKEMCVKLLITKGAKVNRKRENGDTPLHFRVNSGDIEIVKLLVDAGAKNSSNNAGLTPAIQANCFGHEHVLKFLDPIFLIETKQLYDCYCLLAAINAGNKNFSHADIYMRRSLEIRLTDVKLFNNLPQANPIYDNLQEPTNIHELDNILSDEIGMIFIGSIYCECILGMDHPTTVSYLRHTGHNLVDNKRYTKGFDILQCSLDFCNVAHLADTRCIIDELFHAVCQFFIVSRDRLVPPVFSHFQWGIKILEMAHKSKISEVDVVSCLFRMVAVWIMVAESIQDVKHAREELSQIIEAVDLLICLKGRSGCEIILLACLQNLPEYRNSALNELLKKYIPLHKAIALFLGRGCYIHCEDEHGNFPLRLAVRLMNDEAPNCVRTLLDYGAHHDVVNFKKETALDIATHRNFSQYMPIASEIVDELTRAVTSQHSLQCLAACAVVKYGLQYVDVLPYSVSKFVAWHQSDIGSITHCVEDLTGE